MVSSSPSLGGMARPQKRKYEGGRVTPKGTQPGDRPSFGSSRDHSPEASSRYTPPVPIDQKISPAWVPVLMFGLLGLGVLIIFLNYIDVVPGGRSNWYLLGGLGLILGGIITATQYH